MRWKERRRGISAKDGDYPAAKRAQSLSRSRSFLETPKHSFREGRDVATSVRIGGRRDGAHAHDSIVRVRRHTTQVDGTSSNASLRERKVPLSGTFCTLSEPLHRSWRVCRRLESCFASDNADAVAAPGASRSMSHVQDEFDISTMAPHDR